MSPYRDIMDLSRPASGHPRMPRQERAKIFSPFAALRGHEEALQAETRTLVCRAILSDCAQEQIGRKLTRLRRGEQVTLIYFRAERTENNRELGNYVTETDTVTALDTVQATLRLGGRLIPFGDIVDIQWNGPASTN